ncbi:MAG: leucine-rich repeat domain-containing protein [Oscillospiraceae bacterium]|nr:leucine-rich repeat domain-containing protein [Oscillospiraceae bacterium]
MGANKQAVYMLGLNNVGIGKRLIQKEQLTVVKLPLASIDKEKTQEKPQAEMIKIYLTKCKLLGKEPEFEFSEDYKTLIEYTGSSSQVKAPPVEIIQHNAFQASKFLESVVIPDSVKEIEYHAFSWCSSLKDVVIPSSVRKIGKNAFARCVSLEHVVIPNSVQIIDNGTFSYCKSLRAIEIPNSIRSIGHYAFSKCVSLEEIDIPDSVEKVGDNVFADCFLLKTIILHRRYDSIKDWGIPPSCEVVYE